MTNSGFSGLCRDAQLLRQPLPSRPFLHRPPEFKLLCAQAITTDRTSTLTSRVSRVAYLPRSCALSVPHSSRRPPHSPALLRPRRSAGPLHIWCTCARPHIGRAQEPDIKILRTHSCPRLLRPRQQDIPHLYLQPRRARMPTTTNATAGHRLLTSESRFLPGPFNLSFKTAARHSTSYPGAAHTFHF